MTTWTIRDTAEPESSVASSLCEQVSDKQALCAVLNTLADQGPRIVTIEMSETEDLTVGIGGLWAFVEHLTFEPWNAEALICSEMLDSEKPESIWFACGNHQTEVPKKWLIPGQAAINLLAHYFEHGTLPQDFGWDQV